MPVPPTRRLLPGFSVRGEMEDEEKVNGGMTSSTIRRSLGGRRSMWMFRLREGDSLGERVMIPSRLETWLFVPGHPTP